MGHEWKPGDLALIRVGTGDWEYGLLREAGEWACKHSLSRREREDIQKRPVVVIDPENREQIDALVEDAWPSAVRKNGLASSLQAALRSLVTPPRPTEPTGLGAVVEDVDGERWVRDKTTTTVNHWKRARGEDGGSRYPYTHIAVVRVLSEGVTG